MSQLKSLVLFIFVLMSSVSQALETKKADVYKNDTLLGRTCDLIFSNPSTTEILSAVRLNANTLLSVGHSRIFKDLSEVKCGNPSVKYKLKKAIRHPRYDYIDNPKNTSEWAKYDISIVQIDGVQVANSIVEFPIISDVNQVRLLIRSGACVIGGAGNLAEKTRNTISLMAMPSTTGIELDSHVTVIYEGRQKIVHGDSGGPLYCLQNNQWHIAGLLEYGGFIKDRTTGQTKNIVGVMVLRPELINEFIRPHLNL